MTDVALSTVEVDELHPDHATVGLAIRDLKEGAGMEHRRSGHFFANAAWLACAVLAHNLIRRTARFGGAHPDSELTVARTVRTRLLAIPHGSSTAPPSFSCGCRSGGPGRRHASGRWRASAPCVSPR